MSRELVFRPAARAEFDESADWYESQKIGLRADYVHAVDARLSQVLERPFAFRIVHVSVLRRTVVKRFPFAIYFTVDDSEIVVHAVFHTSRNPIIWRGRVD